MIIHTPVARKSKAPIISRQRKQLVLNFIHEYRRIHQVSPTFLEIAKGIGYADNAEGTAHTLCEALVQEGWLRRVAPGARMILPVFPINAIYAEITDPELKRIARQQRNLRILRRL